jgi:uncharacterized RDD family membrane protein YckC
MFFIRYLCALFYDAIILIAIFFGFTALCLLWRQGLPIAPGSAWYQMSLLGIIYYYYFISYRYGGQTIGLMAFKVKLISLTTPITARQIALRILFIIPALMLKFVYRKKSYRFNNKLIKTKLIDIA